MTHEERKKWVKRIATMYAKAATTDSEAERRTFEMHATRLRIQHGITDDELSGSDVTEAVYETGDTQIKSWKELLRADLSLVFGVYTVTCVRRTYKGNEAYYRVFGREADIDRFYYTYEYLLAEIERRTKAYTKRTRCGKKGAREFRIGMGEAVYNRLAAIVHQVAPDKANPFSMTYDEAQSRFNKAEEEAHKAIPNLVSGGVTRYTRSEHMSSGEAAGKRLSVNKSMNAHQRAGNKYLQ